MPRLVPLFLVVLVGLSLGAAGRTLFDHSFAKSKAQQVADLFEQVCLKGEPARDFQDRLPARLVRSDSFGPDALIWIDPVTKVFVDLKRNLCSMQLYGEAAFVTDDMGHALLSLVTDQVARYYPKLKVNPKAWEFPGDVFISWDNAQDSPKSGDQWGNVVIWVRKQKDDFTLLYIRPPRDGSGLNPSTAL